MYCLLQNILVGDSRVVLTGGAENMSQYPFTVREVRFGTVLGAPLQFEDLLWVGLTDTYCKTPMGVTAENLAEKYSIPREEVDQFALRSQTLWKKGTTPMSFECIKSYIVKQYVTVVLINMVCNLTCCMNIQY
jgi:acetyl-CoA acetyltransferase